MSTLWFVLPYAAVLYGIHDRFVRLASAVTLGTTVAFMFMPWASILFAAATVILAAAALVSKSWRKPLEALACTATAGILTIAAVDSLRLHFHPLGPRGRRQSWHPRLRELIPLTRPRLLQAAPPVPTAAAYWRLYYGVEIPATRSKQ